MGQDPSTSSAALTGASKSEQHPATVAGEPEELQRGIEETREQLGDTVEALARKADVKAQAKEKLEDTKASISEKKERLVGKARDASPDGAASAAAQASNKARENPLPLAAAAAFAAGFLVGRSRRG